MIISRSSMDACDSSDGQFPVRGGDSENGLQSERRRTRRMVRRMGRKRRRRKRRNRVKRAKREKEMRTWTLFQPFLHVLCIFGFGTT